MGKGFRVWSCDGVQVLKILRAERPAVRSVCMEYTVSVYIDIEAENKQDAQEKITWFMMQEKGKNKFIDYEIGECTPATAGQR